jgi:hypothetical protein
MIHRERVVNQPSAGHISWNTNNNLVGHLAQLSVNPSSTSTTFDIAIYDDRDTKVYEKKGNKGHTTDESKIGLFGHYTINLSNTSTSTVSWITTLLWDDEL